LSPTDRAKVLEESIQLEEAYAAVALKGDSAVPESAEAEVEFHYICYVKGKDDGRVWELDGDRKGPIDTGVVLPREGEGNVCCEEVLRLVRAYVDDSGEKLGFGLMALVDGEGGSS
jgi:ubiquitin carboxyl-terminal hydrolase L3